MVGVAATRVPRGRLLRVLDVRTRLEQPPRLEAALGFVGLAGSAEHHERLVMVGANPLVGHQQQPAPHAGVDVARCAGPPVEVRRLGAVLVASDAELVQPAAGVARLGRRGLIDTHPPQQLAPPGRIAARGRLVEQVEPEREASRGRLALLARYVERLVGAVYRALDLPREDHVGLRGATGRVVHLAGLAEQPQRLGLVAVDLELPAPCLVAGPRVLECTGVLEEPLRPPGLGLGEPAVVVRAREVPARLAVPLITQAAVVLVELVGGPVAVAEAAQEVAPIGVATVAGHLGVLARVAPVGGHVAAPVALQPRELDARGVLTDVAGSVPRLVGRLRLRQGNPLVVVEDRGVFVAGGPGSSVAVLLEEAPGAPPEPVLLLVDGGLLRPGIERPREDHAADRVAGVTRRAEGVPRFLEDRLALDEPGRPATRGVVPALAGLSEGGLDLVVGPGVVVALELEAECPQGELLRLVGLGERGPGPHEEEGDQRHQRREDMTMRHGGMLASMRRARTSILSVGSGPG